MTKKNQEEEMDYEGESSNDHGDISYELKIPEERVAVLIGVKGETKKEIEQETKCHLDISKEGDVAITGDDGLMLFTVREIIRAIARGFNPKLAMLLLKSDHLLEIIDMKDIAGKNKSTMERLKGRVIGAGGKSRAEIERLTDTHISIYGKTIGILGEMNEVYLARQAVAMLLQGSMHKTVFQFLEKKKKEILFG